MKENRLAEVSAPLPSTAEDRPALKACPFCGGCDTKIDMKPPYGAKSVYCRNAACEASGPWAPTKAQAIAAWNRRPPTAEREGWREALEALVDKLDEVDAHGGMKNAFVIAANHGFIYSGPTYNEELDRARAALSPAPPAGEKQ